MSILHAIVLGITQGLTEFLPVSSSGHLALVPWLFGWDDFAGDESLETAFDVALHLGTLAGAVAYFRRDVVELVRDGLISPLRRRTLGPQGRLAWLLVVSIVPAAITGVTLEEQLDTGRIWLVAVLLAGFGLVLGVADRLHGTRTEAGFGLRDALVIGTAQALALSPGVSRSGVTISVGRLSRFDRNAATRISFLMGLPIIAGAGLYKFIDIGGLDGIPADFRAAFFWGTLTSAFTGWLAVWGLLRFVQTRTFDAFVAYRVIVAVAVLGLLATSVR